jgi:nitronate monooxygenase
MKAWKEIWSAGQGVNTIKHIGPAAELIAELRHEYAQALAEERQPNPWSDSELDLNENLADPVAATA